LTGPVVFVNGYQYGRTGDHSFAATFGIADQILADWVSLFFDVCSVPGNPTIETLGAAFGQYLGALKYTDGTPVTQVDVIAHSMGGLVVRSYLAGKQNGSPATFQPPANPGIRRFVMLGTPNFGTSLANQLGNDNRTAELETASQFLFDLNTWNQGTDDLRGLMRWR
jgi:triacylglycerol esterase/lipase EstA (alpha/beta hydrolase family)